MYTNIYMCKRLFKKHTPKHSEIVIALGVNVCFLCKSKTLVPKVVQCTLITEDSELRSQEEYSNSYIVL